MIEKTIRDSILTAQRCQRNYDLSKEIPQEHLDLLEMSVTECPSKQNIAYYNTHFITDRKIIEKIHEYSYGPGATSDKLYSNPQVAGQLCIVFTERRTEEDLEAMIDARTGNPRYRNSQQRVLHNPNATAEEKAIARNQLDKDRNIALGIAAGYSNLIAAELGYRSGCSQCFMNEEIKELLGIEENVLLLMGIGHNNPEKNRREHQYEDNFIFPSHTKQKIKTKWYK